MIKRDDTLETLSGRRGKVSVLHWRAKEVVGVTLTMTDDPIYKENIYYSITELKL